MTVPERATRRVEDCAFIVFSDDWGRHPSSCQHLFRHVLSRAPVHWINTVGLRSPRLSLYDFKRACGVLKGWVTPSRETSEPSDLPSPTVHRPVMLPFYQYSLARRFNAYTVRRSVEAIRAELEPDRPVVLVSTLPQTADLFASGNFDAKIYYCVDDFTTWPGVDGTVMAELEGELLPHCDVLVATSSKLLRTRGAVTERSRLLTHGVDYEHFARASTLKKPASGTATIGMFGVFDDRTDGKILRALCERMPESRVVVLGPVDRSRAEFADLDNLELRGPVPYDRLPDEVAPFDVLVLPYVVDESTVSINPLKLKEYLATGKPVVTTALPETVQLKDYLRIADRSTFCDEVENALSGNQREAAIEERMTEFLRAESWAGKADSFLSSVLEVL